MFNLFLIPCKSIFVLIQHQSFQPEKNRVLSAFPTWVWRAGPRCETARQMWPSASQASSSSIFPTASAAHLRQPRCDLHNLLPGSLLSISRHVQDSSHSTATLGSSPATSYTSCDPQLTPSPSFLGYFLTLMPVFVDPESNLEGALALWAAPGVPKPWLCALHCSGFAFWRSQNSQFPFDNRFVLSLGDTPSLCKCYKSGVSDPLFTNCCCFPVPAPIRGSADARNVTVASCDRWY